MDEFQKIFEIIERRSGIRVNESHRNYVIDAVKKRQKFSTPNEYAVILEDDQNECSSLIDLVAINETYFFREESQFDFLKKNIFPSFIGKQIMIWSAACSSGEESVSLYALAKSIGCKPIIFATDIDSETLSKMQRFKWPVTSLRSDGEKYKSILEQFAALENDCWTLQKGDSMNFHISKFNLIGSETLPMPDETVDIVFLRNVFIYFSRKNQKIALKRMSEALRPGGLLFLSINEIASIDELDDIPLAKEHSDSVYYLRKMTDTEFRAKKEKPIIRKTAEETLLKPNATQRRIPLFSARAKPDATAKTQVRKTTAVESAPSTTGKIGAENQTPKPDRKTGTIEEVAEKCLKQILAKEYKQAEETIESYRFKSQNIEYKYYLLGRLYNETGDTKQEQAVLSRAVIANPKFWPAWLSLGFLYDRTNQATKKADSFKRCKEILENNIKENKTEYNFIAESFDLSYFLKLCDYYIGNR